MKSKYIIDVFDEKDLKNSQSDMNVEGNEYITETAGFVPLEVKLKQFEQNGYVAQFLDKDFTSTDYRNMYLNPDFDISPEDEIEDVMEKLDGLKRYQEEYKKQKMAKSNGQNEMAGTEEPEKSEKTEETAAAEE